MKCSECHNMAILFQKHSGDRLCAEHFTEGFEQKVKETLLRGKMVKSGEKVAVALSGGKDSSVVLYILDKLLGDQIELFAITIDEGIKGYRDDTVKSAHKIADNLGIEHETISFRHEYGFDLDQVVQEGERPCTICGVFRKNALNKMAKHQGANKLATGHNLDDEAQSIMMNYLKGDIERLMRFRPRRAQLGLVPRIKPLRQIPEKEVALYGMIEGFFHESMECPYASLSFRSRVRDMMNRLENLSPGTKFSTINGYEKVMELMDCQWMQSSLSSCKTCGEPCVKDICKACELLVKLKSIL